MVFSERKSVLLISQAVVLILLVLSVAWHCLASLRSFGAFPEMPLLVPVFLFLLFLAISGYIHFRHREALELQREVASLVGSAVHGKLFSLRHDRKRFMLLLIELLFISVVAVAVTAYIDPDTNFVEWEKLGIQKPISTLLSILLFLVVLAFIRYLWGNARLAYKLQKERERHERILHVQ